LSFSAFSKRISPETKSIGILTQPFTKDAQTRKTDSSSTKLERGRIVVTAFVDFLAERFPDARITIHNSHNETIALSYARMIMANQSMAGVTTFGVFPVISSFGTGYIRKPDSGNTRVPNQWLNNPPVDQLADNIVLMEEPNLLTAPRFQKMWKEKGQEHVLEWLKNGDSPSTRT
jgi:hypothetical protein